MEIISFIQKLLSCSFHFRVCMARCGNQALPKSIRRDWLEDLTSQTQLNAVEVKALYARFRRLAPDGYLLPEQFKQTLGVLGLSDDTTLPEHMFQVFDSSGDGRLTFHDFATALAIMIRGSEDQKLQLSFDMAAGKRNATGLSLQDFRKLIHACRGLTLSLVSTADHASDAEIERLFCEVIGSDERGGEMTLDMYKGAAQNDEFLMALGLLRRDSRDRRRVHTPSASRTQSRLEEDWENPKVPDSEEHILVPYVEIAHLRSRLNHLEELLQEQIHKARLTEEDLLVSCEHSPIDRPAPQKTFVSVAIADAWQELAKFMEESHVIRGKSGSGLLGAEAVPLVPGLDKEDDESREASHVASRMTSKRSQLTEPLWRKQETLQASHRKGRKSAAWRLPGPHKGLAVHFGHESWNMVLSMMVGIRMSVARCKHEMHRELQPVDFIMQEKFTITPRLMPYRDERKTTRFIDFAPMVFQAIRTRFGIQEEEYLRSVGPEQLLGNMVLGNLSSLSELSSEGRSGAFFYYTADGKYMMKTVTPKEFVLLRHMLKGYHDHIKDNPETLIVRFLGFHCLRVQKRVSRFRPRLQKQRHLYFVVMANMFNTNGIEIHRRYDLKGSWVGRVTAQEKRGQHVALKDVDFQKAEEKINLGEVRRSQMMYQIRRDSDFLAKNNIIDYSLLLGVHEREIADSAGVIPKAKHEGGGMLSADGKTIYFMGIIDILTPYDDMKRLEHRFKALRHDWRGVSCCPPAFYASRFCNFLDHAFA